MAGTAASHGHGRKTQSESCPLPMESRGLPVPGSSTEQAAWFIAGFPSGQDAPRLIFECADFLVVRKPAGMPCLPFSGRGDSRADRWSIEGAGAETLAAAALDSVRDDALPTSGQTSLAQWLCAGFPGLATIRMPGGTKGRGPDFGLVHRLDSGTSGLVLVARNAETLSGFLALQEEDLILKEYRFLATYSADGLVGSRPVRFLLPGIWPPSGPIACSSSWPIAVSSRFRPYGPGRARVACLASGEQVPGTKDPTRESYTTLFLSCSEYGSWLKTPVLDCRARITKGFRHQIRAHAAWIGLPLLGDRSYGGLPAGRLCLHARKISFPGPDGCMLTFEDD